MIYNTHDTCTITSRSTTFTRTYTVSRLPAAHTQLASHTDSH